MPYEHKNVSNARALRKQMTPWERKLWHCFLKGYPIKFQRQKPIGNYIADFYCAAAKLVVELDGGGHYTPEEKERDRVRTIEMEKYGIRVVRFCNLDIDRHFYEVCSVIDREVRENYRRGTPPVTP